jgi:hypothetical protein
MMKRNEADILIMSHLSCSEWKTIYIHDTRKQYTYMIQENNIHTWYKKTIYIHDTRKQYTYMIQENNIHTW